MSAVLSQVELEDSDEREHDRYLEVRVDYILCHAPTRTLNEIVAEGLYGCAPELCRAIANGDHHHAGEIAAKAITSYVEGLAEGDWWKHKDVDGDL